MDDGYRIEFLSHPLWEEVFETLSRLRLDLIQKAARETTDHPQKLGRLEGCEAAIRAVEQLIKSSKH